MIYFNKLNYIISIFIFKSFTVVSSLTPLSECTQGRVTGYDEYPEGGSCGFGVPKMYGAAPNDAFYNLGEKCGICYEMVGPMGTLFFMVDSHCPGRELGACNGDMLHFDLHRNGYKTIFEESSGRYNVTFRMVSCDHKSNMILKSKKDANEYHFSFVIMYHNIGLKKVYYSYDNETWTGLEREGDYNHWTVRGVKSLPVSFQFESISGEIVQTTINEIIANNYYDTGVQFSVPNKMYDPFSLKEVESPKIEECCKLNDAFTDIYYEGKYLGEWQDVSACDRISNYTMDCYEGNQCVKVNLKDWKVYQFFNRIKPETRRYNAIKFAVKSEETCDNCLKLKLDDNEFIYLSTAEAGKWEEKIIPLKDLGLNSTTERFRKFMFQGRTVDSRIFYFDSIGLIKSDYIDQGECHTDTIQDYNLNNEKEKENQASSTFIIHSIEISILSILITLLISI